MKYRLLLAALMAMGGCRDAGDTARLVAPAISVRYRPAPAGQPAPPLPEYEWQRARTTTARSHRIKG